MTFCFPFIQDWRVNQNLILGNRSDVIKCPSSTSALSEVIVTAVMDTGAALQM